MNDGLVGTSALIRLILRRDRRRLAIWVLGILALIWFSAVAVNATYDTPEARAGYAATITGSPAAVFLTGPAIALDTPGGITVLETGISAFLTITLFAMFMTVRHTRAEEEDGRLELLRATIVGRFAQLAAAAVVTSVGCLVIGAGITLIFLGQGLDATGSLIFGASIAAMGLCVTAASACAAQVTEHARGALALTGALAGVAYALRGLGDVQAVNDANAAAGDTPVTNVPDVGLLAWFSPYGWAQAAHPFGGDRWWPLVLVLVLTAVLAGVAVRLLASRDLGAGLIAARPGPATAAAWLDGALPLAVRLQRASLLGWAAGLFVLGALYGSMSNSIQDLLDANPDLEDVFNPGGGTLIDGYFQLVILISALITTVFTLTSILRLRSDETRGSAESILATHTSRTRWAGSGALVSGLGTVLLLLVVGVSTGLAAGAVTGDWAWLGELAVASLVYLPASLVAAGVAFLLIGWLPRASAAAWAVVVLAFVVGWLGPLLKTPDWLNNLSPFTHVPGLPASSFELGPIVVLCLIAAALYGAGFAGLRRRDIPIG